MRFPLVMGILNVTPDSFSDGGEFYDPDDAIRHGLKMAKTGAAVIDIGGESTRPNALPIDVNTQKERILPVVRALKQRTDALISVDTRSADVAAAAIEAGAGMINDVSGFLFDPQMPDVLGRYKPLTVAMHMRGTPDTMREQTGYKAILWEIVDELMVGVKKALNKGLPFENVWIDPGIGFAKTAQQSLFLMAEISFFKRLGRPVVVGPSRKSFLEPIIHKPPQQRDWATAATVAWAISKGVDCVRVHNVTMAVDVVNTTRALMEAGIA